MIHGIQEHRTSGRLTSSWARKWRSHRDLLLTTHFIIPRPREDGFDILSSALCSLWRILWRDVLRLERWKHRFGDLDV